MECNTDVGGYETPQTMWHRRLMGQETYSEVYVNPPVE